jgi:hypothetical protein
VARRLLLKTGGRADIGERLLSSKLQILTGVSNRRPAIALSVLTGRLADEHDFSARDDIFATAEPVIEYVAEVTPVVVPIERSRPYLLARTVYLTESHLRDIDAIIQAWQPGRTRRLTRSAVLRRAIEHLRSAVEADPATSLLETELPCPTS